MDRGDEIIEAAAAALSRGEVVGLPTETVYGVAADASNPDALERLFALKGRPESVPLPLAVADPSWVSRWAATDDPRVTLLASRWWPGPLTLVLPATDGVSPIVTGGRPTVAIRIPDQPLTRAILERFGKSVALTSANRHGAAEAWSAAEVRAAFPDGLALVVDGGPASFGQPSTIVALPPDGPAQILRDGAIPASAIREALE